MGWIALRRITQVPGCSPIVDVVIVFPLATSSVLVEVQLHLRGLYQACLDFDAAFQVTRAREYSLLPTQANWKA